MRLAVVLLNLGGPSGKAAIRPFLFNFFMDKRIIPLPRLLRYFIAGWIAWSRSRGAALEAYGHLGFVSPLLQNTQAQARALEQVLREDLPDARVFVAMRHWHPLAAETAQEVGLFRPDKIVLLPLYPQFSHTTTGSALEDWRQEAEKAGLTAPTKEVLAYPAHDGFVEASCDRILKALENTPKRIRLLFSAHGLPERNIRQGDPYQQQCEQTAAAIVKRLNIPLLDWQICYQSRVGRLSWIGPSTGEALEKAADDHVSVIVYPLAFVSEHVETLVEIEIEYRDRARRLGILYFGRAETVGTHPAFIKGLRDLVL